MADNEGTGEGAGTGAGTGQNEAPAWLAQLPADLKANETFTPYKTLGDFAKAHLETAGKVKELDGKVGKVTELETKLSSAIFKPDDKATPEQWNEYYKALGRPEKPTEYEFPVTEGIQRDPKFVEWAQQTFHEIGLPKDMAAKVAAQYDAFTLAMEKANNEAVVKAKADAETAIKAELGAQYPVAVELTTRMLGKYLKPEEKAFFDETGMGNHPVLIRMLFDFAKKTGEDMGVRSANNNADKPKEGFVYDKSPAPPK